MQQLPDFNINRFFELKLCAPIIRESSSFSQCKEEVNDSQIMFP